MEGGRGTEGWREREGGREGGKWGERLSKSMFPCCSCTQIERSTTGLNINLSSESCLTATNFLFENIDTGEIGLDCSTSKWP